MEGTFQAYVPCFWKVKWKMSRNKIYWEISKGQHGEEWKFYTGGREWRDMKSFESGHDEIRFLF